MTKICEMLSKLEGFKYDTSLYLKWDTTTYILVNMLWYMYKYTPVWGGIYTKEYIWGLSIPKKFYRIKQTNIPRVWIYMCIYWRPFNFCNSKLVISPRETGSHA